MLYTVALVVSPPRLALHRRVGMESSYDVIHHWHRKESLPR